MSGNWLDQDQDCNSNQAHRELEAQMARLHGLADRWLAAALLRMARQARTDCPALSNPHARVYGPDLVWHIIPELARRLGVRELEPNESTLGSYRAMQGAQWRETVGKFVRYADMRSYRVGQASRMDAQGTLGALDLLANPPGNGNPVAMALDRLCAPCAHNLDYEDWIARQVLQSARRRGHPDTDVWYPGLQDLPQPEADVISLRAPGPSMG